MLHAGLDLSRKKLDVCLLSEEGAARPVRRPARRREPEEARATARRGPRRAGLRRRRVDDRRPARPMTRSRPRAGRSRSPTPSGSRASPLACKTDKSWPRMAPGEFSRVHVRIEVVWMLEAFVQHCACYRRRNVAARHAGSPGEGRVSVTTMAGPQLPGRPFAPVGHPRRCCQVAGAPNLLLRRPLVAGLRD
jgi:hypothetical protein